MNTNDFLSVLDFLSKADRTNVVLSLNSKLYLAHPRFILDDETIIKFGRLDILKYAKGPIMFFPCLKVACKFNNLKIIKFLLNNLNDSMEKEISFYDKNKNKYCYLNSGFEYACLYGHLQLVYFFIVKMIGNIDISWSDGLIEACKGGHLEIAELMIEKGARRFDEGLEEACERGHDELVYLMICEGADGCRNCDNEDECHWKNEDIY